MEKVRVTKKEKFVSLEGRWRVVEAGQLQLKQNLVKFNNFVREKQGKVEEGRLTSRKFVETNR